MGVPVSHIENIDCIEFMRKYPDKFFELAIVDPPYGIGVEKMGLGKGKKKQVITNKYTDKRPTPEYFNQLFRVSKNQIIWGGNYFISNLFDSKCFIIWDKIQEFSGADFEAAWTSFSSPSKAFRMSRVEAYVVGTIHPTQKPIALYQWILTNYAKQGDKILDTHLGSGSSRIAAYKLGFDFYACEIDSDYFKAQEERFNKATYEPLFEKPKYEQSILL
jgi:site-specific DNA-methyltransferase (adenine-specific)